MPVTYETERDGAERRTFGDALQLSQLLGAVRVPFEYDCNELPLLQGQTAIADWGAHTQRTLRERFGHPVPLCERKASGAALRRRTLTVLRRLQNGSSAAGLTRKQIGTLRELALLCGRDQDWASPTGPLVGASNDEIARRLGGRDPTEAFKPLIARGLISRHRRRGNGHRYFRIINKDQDNERIEASGFSLAPLIILIEALEVLASYEEDLVEEHISLPRRISAALCEAKELLVPFLGLAWAMEADQRIKSLSVRSHNARKGGVDRKRSVLIEASDLLSHVRCLTHQSEAYADELITGAKTDPLGGESAPHIYSETYSLDSSCNGSAAERSDDRGVSSPSLAPNEGDEHGIERSGFDWGEVPHLFPFTQGMLHLDPHILRPGAMSLARMNGMTNLAIIERAIATIGLESTVLALLVTGQHSADDEIRRTPEIYFRGLVKRGREGDLNLGHSIFGRRKVAGLNVSARRSTVRTFASNARPCRPLTSLEAGHARQ